MAQDIEVSHNPAKRRFEATIDGHLAVAEYRLDGKVMIFHHTLVPGELRGKGVAGALVAEGLDYAKRNSRRVVAQCSYVARYIERHPEYATLLSA